MLNEVKILLLLIAQRLERVLQSTVSRYIIRNHLSDFKELPIWKLLSWSYVKSLTLSKLFGLGVIASFTLVSFPLGVWIGSFAINKYLPLSNAMAYSIEIFTVPLMLFVFNKFLSEMELNRSVLIGLGLVEVGYFVVAVGWFMIYRGNM